MNQKHGIPVELNYGRVFRLSHKKANDAGFTPIIIGAELFWFSRSYGAVIKENGVIGGTFYINGSYQSESVERIKEKLRIADLLTKVNTNAV